MFIMVDLIKVENKSLFFGATIVTVRWNSFWYRFKMIGLNRLINFIVIGLTEVYIISFGFSLAKLFSVNSNKDVKYMIRYININLLKVWSWNLHMYVRWPQIKELDTIIITYSYTNWSFN